MISCTEERSRLDVLSEGITSIAEGESDKYWSKAKKGALDESCI